MKKTFIKIILLATLIGANVLGITSNASACTIQKRVRLGGQDRFETAIAVSKEFEKGDKIENILLC